MVKRDASAVERAARKAQVETEERAAMAKEEEEEAERARVAEAARLAKAQAEQDTSSYTVHCYRTPGRPYTPWTVYPFKLKSEDHSWSFQVVSKIACPPSCLFVRHAEMRKRNESMCLTYPLSTHTPIIKIPRYSTMKELEKKFWLSGGLLNRMSWRVKGALSWESKFDMEERRPADLFNWIGGKWRGECLSPQQHAVYE